MFVRSATESDIAAVAVFDEWNRAERAIRAGTCFVAGIDYDVVLAYGTLAPTFFARPFVATIFVHPDHRRAGLGETLLRHFISITDHAQLWISTNSENIAMQGLLAKLGFRESGIVHNLAELPELIYVKEVRAESGG